MIVAGVQILTSRMMDARKTFVVGVSVVLGLSVDMLPGAYQSCPCHVPVCFYLLAFGLYVVGIAS